MQTFSQKLKYTKTYIKGMFLMFFLLGLFINIGSLFSYKNQQYFLNNGIKTIATITNVESHHTSSSKGSSTSYSYKYIFSKKDGSIQESSASYISFNFKKGDKIKIIYDPNNSKETLITLNSSSYQSGFIMGTISIFISFFILSIGLKQAANKLNN
jgi:hypothetical protein